MKASLGALSMMALLGCQTPEPSAAGASEATNPLVTGPDFVVTELNGPSSVLPGDVLEVTARVCNHGGQGGATQAELFLSADTVFSPQTDLPGGKLYLPYLAPGQCSRQTARMSAQVPTNGVWYVGARLDSLGDENPGNNTRFSAPVGIGFQADFVVTSVKGPASVEHGQRLTAQVTVCNQGTRSESTQVALLLSEDADIRLPSSSSPTKDSFVGEAPVPWLAPGQCTTVSISGNAYPPPPSTPDVRAFHLGAVLNPSASPNELRTDNNTHPGYVLGVGYAPDFVITSVKGPASVESGQPLTAQVTVCNQGTRSRDTSVALVLSEDEHFRVPSPSTPPEDVFVGGTQVQPLAPGQCTTVSISGNISPPPPSTPGVRAFHLGAMLDPNDPSELRTDNNTHPGYLLGVGYAPDFVISSVKGPTSVEHGQPLTAQVTVCNQGTRPRDTRVLLLLSQDEHLRLPSPSTPPEDQIVDDAPVPPLAPGQCTTVSLSSSNVYPPPMSPPDVRAFHLGAVVDPYYSPEELRTDNNTHPGYVLGMGYAPDFVISSVKGPASVDFGQPLTAQVTVCNQGTRRESTYVMLALSQDEHIRPPSPSAPPEDSFLGGTPVPPLAPGQCTTVSLSSSNVYPPPMSPPDVRAFHLGAVLDPSASPNELRTDNNTHPGYLLGVGYAPDFVITSVKGPASVEHGQPLSAQVTVCNQGTRRESTQVLLVLSQDEHIRLPSPSAPPEDQVLGGTPVSALAPNQCATVSLSASSIYPPPMSPPDTRTFHLGAVVDPNYAPGELRTDNNTHPGYLLGVGYEADFVITSVQGPASVEQGQPLSAQVTVCNQGTSRHDSRVFLLLSEDENIRLPSYSGPFEDQVVGDAPVPPLAPNQCATVSISTSGIHPPPMSPPDTRTFHLGAVMDPNHVPEEFRTDNNTHPGYLLSVGQDADFVITSVESPVFVRGGQSLTTQVNVCNQGTLAASTRVSVLLSTDTTLQLPSPSAPSTDVIVGEAQTGLLQPGWCETVSITGNALPPPSSNPDTQGLAYVGAAVNLDQMNPELRVDNNTLLGGWIYIAP